MGVSKSCKYKFTCEFTHNKICKFEISVKLHHQIPVNCKVSNIINIISLNPNSNYKKKIAKLTLSCRIEKTPLFMWPCVFFVVGKHVVNGLYFCSLSAFKCLTMVMIVVIMILSARLMIVCRISTGRQNIDWHFVQDIVIMGETDLTTLIWLCHIYETIVSYDDIGTFAFQ